MTDEPPEAETAESAGAACPGAGGERPAGVSSDFGPGDGAPGGEALGGGARRRRTPGRPGGASADPGHRRRPRGADGRFLPLPSRSAFTGGEGDEGDPDSDDDDWCAAPAAAEEEGEKHYAGGAPFGASGASAKGVRAGILAALAVLIVAVVAAVLVKKPSSRASLWAGVGVGLASGAALCWAVGGGRR